MERRKGARPQVITRGVTLALILPLLYFASLAPSVRAQQPQTAAGFPSTPAPQAVSVTLNVPGYLWRHGCAATAAGMVLAYYDALGYGDLLPGDGSSQTDDINQAIASESGDDAHPRHYEDYSEPLDTPLDVKKDKSESPTGDEHANDCIADYMKTSWSSRGISYGVTLPEDVGPGLAAYVQSRNPAYNATCVQLKTSNDDLTWDVLKAEIDAGRPMIFLMDMWGVGYPNHFGAAVGYRDSPRKQYACLDTNPPATEIRWYDFKKVAPGTQWGVYSGWTVRLAPLAGSVAVNVTPDAGRWTLTGPEGFAPVVGHVGDYPATAAPIGQYTLTCDDVILNYDPPAPDARTLSAGSALVFAPVYVWAPETRTILDAILGRAGGGAGLDINIDAIVDIADVVTNVNRGK